MSAKTKTLIKFETVIDHDCGNYRIGEIDYVDYDAVRQFVLADDPDDFREHEIYRVCAKILGIAQAAGVERRTKLSQEMMAGI